MLSRKTQSGFTLIEVLVALALVGITLGTIFGILKASISTATTVVNQLIAANLAQEGIELVRNIRDSNYVAGLAWDAGMDVDNCLLAVGNPAPAKACEIDYNTGLLDITPDDTRLRIDGNGGYSYSGTRETPFMRQIFLERGQGGISTTSIRVRVNVGWDEKGRSDKVVAETMLYDWFK